MLDIKIIPLGTNGYFPSFGRQTACFAVPLGKILIVLDAGSGIFRFAEPDEKKHLEGVTEIHLYLSHYHLDHTFGFYAVWELFRGKTVKVFGKDEQNVFSEFGNFGYFPLDYKKEFKNFSFHALEEKTYPMNAYTVSVRRQHHGGHGSLSFRFEFSDKTTLAYVTDSEPTDESVAFVHGASLLLHEHFAPGDDILREKGEMLKHHFFGGHTTTIGAALVAKKANVGKLALVHHYPYNDEKKLEKQLVLARSIFPNTILAKDNKAI